MMEAGATAMENYAKGMMLQGPRSGDGTLKTMITGGDEPPAPNTVDPGAGVEPPESPEPATVDELIADWNANNKTMSKDEKMALLTQIIDMYDAQNDGYHAKMWRIRRLTVARDHTAENLAIYNNMINGGEYSTPNSFSADYYADMNEDMAVFNDFNNRWNSGQCTDEEGIFFREYFVSLLSTRTLYYTIQCKNPNSTPAQVESYKNSAKSDAYSLMNSWLPGLLWNDPQYANADWQVAYNNDFTPMFTKFQTVVNDNATQSDIAAMASDLQNVVAELREQGFPYCDQLLIAIQGYIASAGYFGDPNVLPEG